MMDSVRFSISLCLSSYATNSVGAVKERSSKFSMTSMTLVWRPFQDILGKPVPVGLRYWILLELRMTEAVVTARAIRCRIQ